MTAAMAGSPPAVASSRRRTFHDDAAFGQDHQSVRHPLGLGQLMGRQDDADSLVLQSGDDGADGNPALGIDAAGGLVEERHLWPSDQRQRKRKSLLLAAREVAPLRGGDGAEADRFEQLSGGDRVRVVGGEEIEHPLRPEHRVDAAALQHHPHAPGQRGVVRDRIEAEHPHLAGVGAAVALERFDRRGLAGTVRAEDDEDLAGIGRQVEIVDRRRSVGGPVAHREATDLDCWHGVAGYFDEE